VHDIQFGRLVRAGVGRTVIVDFEAGRLGGMRLNTQRQIAVALGFSMDVTPRGLGADADRLLDQGHAVLMGATTKWLDGLGWRRVPEVSYSEWGERGSIDLLAWHEATGTLLVIEIKTELVSVEATLRKLDEKVRLAPRIALSRFGWRAEAAGGGSQPMGRSSMTRSRSGPTMRDGGVGRRSGP
jgi:hypothetical protein